MIERLVKDKSRGHTTTVSVSEHGSSSNLGERTAAHPLPSII